MTNADRAEHALAQLYEQEFRMAVHSDGTRSTPKTQAREAAAAVRKLIEAIFDERNNNS